MTSIEKAETALNRRIERLQANLSEADSDAARQFLFLSLVVCVGLGEALTAYIKAIGQFAEGRHAELKQTHAELGARHADLLKSGQELLERLKAAPTDQAIRKEIDRAQRDMAAIQKTLRRGANSLQRDVAPSLAMIDPLADTIRRLAEADQIDALKRVIKLIVGHVRDLYRAQPTLPVKDIIDAAAWEKSAVVEIDQAPDFHAAYARTGSQALLAVDLMTMAVSSTPPQTAEDATHRAHDSVATRLKSVTVRLTTA